MGIEEEMTAMKRQILKPITRLTPNGVEEGYLVEELKDLLLIKSVIPIEEDRIRLMESLLKEGHKMLVTEDSPNNKYQIIYEEKTDQFSNWRQINSI